MTTFLLTFAFFAFAMVAMAAGVILSDRELQGSCGGAGSKDCLCAIEKRRMCSLIKHGGAKGVSLSTTMSSEQRITGP